MNTPYLIAFTHVTEAHAHTSILATHSTVHMDKSDHGTKPSFHIFKMWQMIIVQLSKTVLKHDKVTRQKYQGPIYIIMYTWAEAFISQSIHL